MHAELDVVDALIRDLRYAARALLRSRGFTLVAVLTLALGIGANTAIFSVVNAVLLRPLPYAEPDRLVVVWESNPRSAAHNVVNPGNFLDWRERARSFSGMGVFTWSGITFAGERPERSQGLAVSLGLFGVLGARPLLGRTFVPADADSGAPRTLVLSHALWVQRFGGDSAVVGRSVPVAGGLARVVGVMPADFRPLWNEDYWEPFALTGAMRQRSGRYCVVVARLKAGVSAGQAQAEMTLIARGLEREYPQFDKGWGATVVPITEQVVGAARRPLLVLLSAVGFVLLIACANVGNLLVARAVERWREVAVRTALGASRGRIARAWLVECVLLSLTGAVAGLLLATWGLDLLRQFAKDSVPRLNEVRLDVAVLAFTAGVAVVAGLALGIGTAGVAVGRQPASVLKSEDSRTTGGAAARRFRGALVGAQVALALVLLVGAGLLVRSLARLLAVDPGFDPAHVVTAHIALPGATYPDPERQTVFYTQLLERLRGMPRVEVVGAVTFLPLAGPGAATGFTIVGQPPPAPGQGPTSDIRIATDGYFKAMGIPLLRGRTFEASDAAGGREVAVVNQTLAERYWPGEDPIGRGVKVSWTHPDAEVTIVGVVGDVRYQGLDRNVRPMLYYRFDQEPSGEMDVVVRGPGAPAAILSGLREAVRALDRGLPPARGSTMEQQVAASTQDRRLPMQLLGLFAVLALVLAAIGIYGVLAYTVRLRVREIGVRMALGADPGAVVRMIVGSGLGFVLAGVATGVVGALLVTSVLRSLLFGIEPTDLATFVTVTLLLVGTALLASWLPARRAAKVDPVVALRSE